MADRATIAHAAADALDDAAHRGMLPRVLVGFDGFVDSIVHMVRRRRSMTPEGYERISTIAEFAQRCAAAAGTSTNIERVTLEDRFGGNGPLMAGALAALGAPTTFIGAIGTPSPMGARAGGWAVHPTFAELASRCARCLPIAEPSHTLCMEFDDGKLMFNDTANAQAVTWDRLLAVVGLDPLRRMVAESSLIGVVNWSLLGGVEGIWDGLRTHVFETLVAIDPRPRRVFIDLSDPAKRLDNDIHHAMDLLRRLEHTTGVRVTLGLNLAEARRLAQVFNTLTPESPSTLPDAAQTLRGVLDLDTVVIHPREGAAGADDSGAAWFDGPLVARPILSTGAGDHFNAGFALAQSLGLPLPQCLASGCAVSGAYVRDGRSPDLPRVGAMLRDMPPPET